MNVYERIDAFLESLGISRRQLAIKACIPPSTLQTALSREKGLSPNIVQKIADTLEIPVDLLISDKYDIYLNTPESTKILLDKLQYAKQRTTKELFSFSDGLSTESLKMAEQHKEHLEAVDTLLMMEEFYEFVGALDKCAHSEVFGKLESEGNSDDNRWFVLQKAEKLYYACCKHYEKIIDDFQITPLSDTSEE